MKREQLLIVFETESKAIRHFEEVVEKNKDVTVKRKNWLYFCTSTSEVRLTHKSKLSSLFLTDGAPLFCRIEFKYEPTALCLGHCDRYTKTGGAIVFGLEILKIGEKVGKFESKQNNISEVATVKRRRRFRTNAIVAKSISSTMIDSDFDMV